MRSHAVLSDDELYRYSLLRVWDEELPTLVFVMLNPSTADAEVDDPTIRRCISFAKREGCGKLIVLNLYAFRATNPKALLTCADPVGDRNDSFLRANIGARTEFGFPVVAAWGVNADPARVAEVIALVPDAKFVSLGVTKAGHPRHPLYVLGDQELTEWRTA
ncbi:MULTISPECIES: DUF1643 domain-containing protein [unclassified Cryobacterium]|uniref:DUF1643 domain-containing protein n=1 Tax=unclassified Cryobacterium TaxID=2649013 RepID=UPI0018E0654A|nr:MULTISPECIES: DUF1643 domain-containing protein [unclassified Cryobacterium]